MMILGENKTDLLLHWNPADMFSFADCCQINCNCPIISVLHHLFDSIAQAAHKVF